MQHRVKRAVKTVIMSYTIPKNNLRPLQNTLFVAPAQAGAQSEAQLQLSGKAVAINTKTIK